MNATVFPERRPVIFGFLVILAFFLAGAAGVVAAQITHQPANAYTVYSQAGLLALFAIFITAMRWWGAIGFRPARSARSLALYLPALILFIANLTFGIQPIALPALVNFALIAILSGLIEEAAFRGMILRAFLPRGAWTAVLVSTAFFGFSHAFNVLGISSPAYVAVQIGYALAIGFGFAAMALRGGLVWPLAVAHALGNFAAFLNSGQVGGDQVSIHLMVVSTVYIVVFTAYGLYLMLKKDKFA